MLPNDITQRSYYTMVCVTCEKSFKSRAGVEQRCEACKSESLAKNTKTGIFRQESQGIGNCWQSGNAGNCRFLGNRESQGIGNPRQSAIVGNRRESGMRRECGNLQAIGNVGNPWQSPAIWESTGNQGMQGIIGNWQLREFIIGNCPRYSGDSGDSSV